MQTVEILTQYPALFFTFVVILGLCVGSFLNVVIHRLPLMLEKQWRSQCNELLELEKKKQAVEPAFNLLRPGSHCPECQTPIPPWFNIPVLGYLLLKGRCKNCNKSISVRYPLVEVLTAVLFLMVALRFGVSAKTMLALILSAGLVALAFIDFDHQLLPDIIVLPLLWLGLLLNLDNQFADLYSAVIGAAAGYLILWLVYQLFRLITGKEGMGYGDFKLLALFGAWLGWQMLPLILLLSAGAGAVIGIGLIAIRGRDRNLPIPFGPYLAIAGWIALLWGSQLVEFYLHYSGLA